MHSCEEAYRSSSELYWIAFLLTGDKELSLQVTLNALSYEEGTESMLPPSSLKNLRMAVIREATAATQAEITSAARRFAVHKAEQGFSAVALWPSDATISNLQIEKALLAIDLFPRCALLLTVFEGLPIEQVEKLLHCSGDLIASGRMSALKDLTRNLRPAGGPAPKKRNAERTKPSLSDAGLTRKSEWATSLEAF